MRLKLLLVFVFICGAARAKAGDEFVGPLSGWADLRRDYGEKGDGLTDDTAALQNPLRI